MPRSKKRRAKKAAKKKTGAKRGRKPIFTDEQKRVLERLIREALRTELRDMLKGL